MFISVEMHPVPSFIWLTGNHVKCEVESDICNNVVSTFLRETEKDFQQVYLK